MVDNASTASMTLDAVADAATQRETAWRQYEDAVIAAHRDGHSLRAIGQAAGISYQAVQQFLANRLEDA